MNKEYVQYSTIREDFSEYKCENGQILRVKMTIVSIVNEIKNDSKSSLIDFKEISSVITPLQQDTSHLSAAKPEEVTDKDIVKELPFEIIQEIINIYETKKSLIIVAPVIQKIYLTNKKDKDSNPILRYLLKNSLNIIDKKLFIEGPQSK